MIIGQHHSDAHVDSFLDSDAIIRVFLGAVDVSGKQTRVSVPFDGIDSISNGRRETELAPAYPVVPKLLPCRRTLARGVNIKPNSIVNHGEFQLRLAPP